MSVTYKDNGAKALVANIGKAHKASVDVGVLGEKAAAKEDKGTLTVGEVASFHEFGLGVPERSFIRGWVDENEKVVQNLSGRAVAAVAKGMPVDQALTIIGSKIASLMQERISRGIEPANAPSTIARKGSSKPLVNTGQLRSSITPRVAQR